MSTARPCMFSGNIRQGLACKWLGKPHPQHHRQHHLQPTVVCKSYDSDSGYDGYEVHHLLYPTGMQPLKAFTLGREGTWVVSSRQDTYWSSGLPDELWDALNEADDDDDDGLHYVAYASTSTQYWSGDHGSEAWFVSYCNDTCAWGDGLPQSLHEALDEYDDISAVYLGPSGAWLITFDNGAILYDNLPHGMTSAVQQSNDTYGGVQNVAMGPDGEWFVRSQDGTIWRNSLHPSLERLVIDDDIANPRRIRLGPEATYIAEFPDRLVWRTSSDCSDAILELATEALSQDIRRETDRAVSKLNLLMQRQGIPKLAAKGMRNVLLQLRDSVRLT